MELAAEEATSGSQYSLHGRTIGVVACGSDSNLREPFVEAVIAKKGRAAGCTVVSTLSVPGAVLQLSKNVHPDVIVVVCGGTSKDAAHKLNAQLHSLHESAIPILLVPIENSTDPQDHVEPLIADVESVLAIEQVRAAAASGGQRNRESQVSLPGSKDSRLRQLQALSAAADVKDAVHSGVPVNIAEAMLQFKETLKKHGARGIIGLARKFRIGDDDGSGALDFGEFQKIILEHRLSWPDETIRDIFDYFDTDQSGQIKFDEFLVGIRGTLNARRKDLVMLAFQRLDKTKNGRVELIDITQAYDASKHPDVIAGRRSSSQILREFLDTFDCGEKDGIVTFDEFCKYYANISASIDDDDYFELVIRNAWHISGGKGAFENTTCRRVLVTHEDGSQTVEEIRDDLGMSAEDVQAARSNLTAQGMKPVAVQNAWGSSPTRSERDAAARLGTQQPPAGPSPGRVRRGGAMASSLVLG